MEYPEQFSSTDSPQTPDEDAKVYVPADILMKAQHELLDFFIDEFSICATTQFGREIRYGELEELGMLESIPEEYKVNTTPGLDIFGQPVTKNTKSNFECECPKCKRTLAAARFAQHLEKCMGMGRNSSRIASRRLAAASTANSSNSGGNNAGTSGATNHPTATVTSQEGKCSSQGSNSSAAPTQQSNGEMNLGTDDEHFSEDDDEEWTMEKKKKKKSSDKSTPKRKGASSKIKVEAVKRKAGSPSLVYNESSASNDFFGGPDEDGNTHMLSS